MSKVNWERLKLERRLKNTVLEEAFPIHPDKPLRKPQKQKGYSPLVWKLRNQEAELLRAQGKTMTLNELVLKFGGSGKKNGSYIEGNCPTMKHPDKSNRRLLIAESTRQANRTYLKCMDGCTVDEILAAAGIKYSDLYNKPREDAPPDPDAIGFKSKEAGSMPDQDQIVDRIKKDVDYILNWGTRDTRNDLLSYIRSELERVEDL